MEKETRPCEPDDRNAIFNSRPTPENDNTQFMQKKSPQTDHRKRIQNSNSKLCIFTRTAHENKIHKDAYI